METGKGKMCWETFSGAINTDVLAAARLAGEHLQAKDNLILDHLCALLRS
jgi:hypothetical protein